jgi:SNF2 family DNA or RNA helicase
VLESLCDRYKARDLVLTLSGEIDAKEGAARRTAFNAPGAPIVLIASQVGQVGIDLQAYAEHVVHYELEWNPARMEQREGRVDRLGRRGDGKVKVYYLVCQDTYDERMFLQTSRRQLWHRLLIGRHRGLESETERPLPQPVADLGSKAFGRLALDLRPR